MMVRRRLLDEMGGLDERLVTARADRLRACALSCSDAKMTFADKAWVTYMARDAFDPIDLRYHLFRWSDRFVVESLDAFEETWGVTLDRQMYRYRWAAGHRLRAAETTYPRRRQDPREGALRVAGSSTRCERRGRGRAVSAARAIGRSVPSALDRERAARRSSTRVIDDAARRRNDVTAVSGLPRVAGMATMPSRAGDGAACDRVDAAHRSSGSGSSSTASTMMPPYAERREDSGVAITTDVGDLRANGKLVGLVLETTPCTFFGVDDDVEYPADYCGALESAARALRRQSGSRRGPRG